MNTNNIEGETEKPTDLFKVMSQLYNRTVTMALSNNSVMPVIERLQCTLKILTM